MKTFILALLILASSYALGAQSPPSKSAVHYTKKILVPTDKTKPDTITIKYDDLYPGERKPGGGCSFSDVSNPKGVMPIVEDKPDHVTLRAPRGDTVEYHCNWYVVPHAAATP